MEEALNGQLKRWEKIYGYDENDKALGERFGNLLIRAKEKTGLRSVVLVDEYDKPLMDVFENEELQNHNKEVFKGFFSILKSFDEYIHFIFITGVSKFHKVSIFSDLNQLKDISLTQKYSALCGITESELKSCFATELEGLALAQSLSVDECMKELKKTYDGYMFHPKGVGVYNPYSLLNALEDKEFGSYWFATGTPTFLVKKIRETDFDVRKFTDGTLYAGESMLRDYTGEGSDPVPLLYQTGYLTISDYDDAGRVYTLSFPNEEVKYGFVESLMHEYVNDYGAGSGKDIFTLRKYVEQGETEKIRDVFAALFASIPYTKSSVPFEHYFQTVIYIVFTLLKKYVTCELHTFTGRIDCVLETQKFVYLFEFKRDDTAEAALSQIDTMEYALPFAADPRKMIKIGASFDSATRKLNEWKVL